MPEPHLTASSFGDVQVGSLPELNRFRVTEIATAVQRFVFMNLMLRKGQVETMDGTGKSFQFQVMVNDSGTAANVGMGYSDPVVIRDTLTSATGNWVNSKADFAIVGQEEDMNASPAKIVDVRLMREKATAISLVQLMEANWWGPPVTITDTLTPWGVNTIFPKNSSEGFNGGAPSGFTSIFLNPTTYPNWKNYTFQYTDPTDGDFVNKLNRAIEFTDFEPPVEGIPTLRSNTKYAYFSNYGLIGPLQNLLKASNDNLGMDITKYAGAVVINRAPLVRVPFLEADTTNPIYGLSLGDIKLFRLRNWWMRRTHVPMVPGHHTAAADYFDSTYQFVATNKRTTFTGATAATYPG